MRIRQRMMPLILVVALAGACAQQPAQQSTPGPVGETSLPSPGATSVAKPVGADESPAAPESAQENSGLVDTGKVVEGSHFFGNIDQGLTANCDFLFTNETQETLTLGPVETTAPCCLVADLSKTTLQPGESVKIDVRFESVHRPGELLAEIYVPISGGETLVYQVGGQVTETVTWHPAHVTVKEGEKQTLEVRSSLFSQGFKIEDIEVIGNLVRVKSLKVEGDKQLFEVDATSTNLDSSASAGVVKFRTNHDKITDVIVGFDVVASGSN